MNKQVIISVGRQYGSGGREIARKLADRLQLPFYDRNLLDVIALEKNVDGAQLKEYDEKPHIKILHRKINGYSSSPQEAVAQMQFDLLKEMASEGKSFVIVGRCSEEVLKEYPGLITVFVTAPYEMRVNRIIETEGLSEKKAISEIKWVDNARKEFHNSHCEIKWGNPKGYDLVFNRRGLSDEQCAELLEVYVGMRSGLSD